MPRLKSWATRPSRSAAPPPRPAGRAFVEALDGSKRTELLLVAGRHGHTAGMRRLFAIRRISSSAANIRPQQRRTYFGCAPTYGNVALHVTIDVGVPCQDRSTSGSESDVMRCAKPGFAPCRCGCRTPESRASRRNAGARARSQPTPTSPIRICSRSWTPPRTGHPVRSIRHHRDDHGAAGVEHDSGGTANPPDRRAFREQRPSPALPGHGRQGDDGEEGQAGIASRPSR